MIRMRMFTVPNHIFARLTAAQMCAVNAMANKARAKHWIDEARATDDKALRGFRVAFARSAHSAYIKDLQRVLVFARERL